VAPVERLVLVHGSVVGGRATWRELRRADVPGVQLIVLERPGFAPNPPQDVDFALSYVKQHATTRADQEAVLAALRFKCDVLWAQLDALHHAYVTPGHVPPGAFRPETVKAAT